MNDNIKINKDPWRWPMICPKCNASMEIVEFGNIEVDRCTNCSGIWFDALEKEALKSLKKPESIDIGDPKLGEKFNKLDRIACPVCQVPMIRMVDHQQWHIWFESCPVCHGAFFDAGEFKDLKQKTILDTFRSLSSKERR